MTLSGLGAIILSEKATDGTCELEVFIADFGFTTGGDASCSRRILFLSLDSLDFYPSNSIHTNVCPAFLSCKLKESLMQNPSSDMYTLDLIPMRIPLQQRALVRLSGLPSQET